jgi:hypothetical protein
VPQREVDKATSIPERFLIRWRGEADPARCSTTSSAGATRTAT